MPSSPFQTRLGPGSVDRAGSRHGYVGLVLGATQLALTTTYLVALWAVARREDRIDPNSWSLVGAYVATVYAAPLLVLGAAGTVFCLLRRGDAALGGTIVVALASAATTASCLYLGWIALTQGGMGPETALERARRALDLLLVAVALAPWAAAGVAHRVTRRRRQV